MIGANDVLFQGTAATPTEVVDTFCAWCALAQAAGRQPGELVGQVAVGADGVMEVSLAPRAFLVDALDPSEDAVLLALIADHEAAETLRIIIATEGSEDASHMTLEQMKSGCAAQARKVMN